MKGKSLLIALICLFGIQSYAQQRYLEPVFDEVEVLSDQVYGVNHTVLLLPVLGRIVPQPLTMDVYHPAGDTLEARPVVIVLHTGNFLPIQINAGVTGTKSDSAVVEICTRLARMGYVAISADYRLGGNPLAATQPERAFGLINAAYRGVQDVRTCIRFLKRGADEGSNSLRIDTSKITVWGNGTGGYIALAAATLDQYIKIVTTQQPAGKFLISQPGGMPVPMIIEPINGDINGETILGVVPAGFPGLPPGDTLALPNHPGYSSDFQLAVNLGGALGDISWMDENSTAVISFHVPNDQFAPYQTAVLVVPTTNDPIVEVQGSLLLQRRAAELGLNEAFSVVNDDMTESARAASAKAGHEYIEGLFPLNTPPTGLPTVNGAPWDWWDPAIWNAIPHPNAGQGGVPAGATYHVVASLSNPTMSAEQGRAYIDTIMGYFAPRAAALFGLVADELLSVPELNKRDIGLSVWPNPSSGTFQIRTDVDHPMQSIRIYDVSGKIALQRPRLGVNQIEINHHTLPGGLYYIEIILDKGRVVEPVLLRP